MLISGFKKCFYKDVQLKIILPVLFFAIPTFSFAIIYQPGTTLNPDCAPSDTNCGVATSSVSGPNSTITELSGLTTPINVSSGGTGRTSYSVGDILYANSSTTLSTLNIGVSGKVLKILGGVPTWGDDVGGVSYTASEQGLHLDTGSNTFSLALDGASLSTGLSGLKISDSYTGQTSINTLGYVTTGEWHASTLTIPHGGTALTTIPTNGQLLIGNGTGYSLANITAGDGVIVTNGPGSIALNLAITGAPTITTANSNDYIPIYTSGDEHRKKISYSDLFAGVLGALTYQGTWNANTNSPALSDLDCATTTKGRYYVIGTSGTTTIGAVSNWSVGDWVVCNGTSWEQTLNTINVNSIFGRTGSIVSVAGDYTSSQINNVSSGNINSTNVQAALNELDTEKEVAIIAGTSSQYFRGDKTWHVLDTAAVAEDISALYFTDARARGAMSVPAIGLSYSTSTGALSLQTGYHIPLTASTTEWSTSYNRSVLSWSGPLLFSSGTVSILQSSATTSGYLSSTDWNTFNNKVSTSRSINTTGPLQGGGDLSSNRTLSITQSSSSTDGYLSSIDWALFNNKQNQIGYTPENVSNKSNVTTLGTSDVLYPTQNAVKTYVDNLSLGFNWKNPVELINLIGDLNSPPVVNINNDAYIINTGGNTGVWSSFAPGDLVQYQTSAWVKIRSLNVGDWFGISFKSTTTATSSMIGKDNYRVNISGGTPGSFTYTFYSPSNSDAVLVDNENAFYYGVSFVYSSTLSEWVQMSASVNFQFGSGLGQIGSHIHLGNLTEDWVQNNLFNIVSNGDAYFNGGDLKTTTSTATLFNENASVLNIGGAATTIGLGGSGAVITGGGALTLKSATGTALTIDPNGSATLNLGTGNNSKTINLGTGSGGNSFNIGTNNTIADTISIGSALDTFSLTSNGVNISTSGAITGVSSINTIAFSPTAITFAGEGSVLSAGSSTLTVDSNSVGAVNFGTGDSSKQVTVGNLTGTSSLILRAGSLPSSFTTSNGAISFITGTGSINIGADTVSKTITIGNGTGATSLALNAGTGGIDIGANAVARTINIGTGDSVAQIINVGGTGANTISIANTQTAGSLNIGNAMTTGGITIGSTVAQTGNFILAPGTGSQTIEIGNNNGLKTIHIGSGVSGNNISIGNGANTSAQTLNIASGSYAGNSTVNILSGVASAGSQTLNLGTGASAKTVNIGNTSGASSLTLDSGTGSILIGTGAQNRIINIGSGAANQTVTLGSTSGGSTLTLESGTGTIAIGTGAVAKTITIGNTTGATSLVLNSGTGTISIGGSIAKTVSVGNTTGASILNLLSGSGGTNITTTNSAFILNTGTGSIDIGTDAFAKAIRIGTTTGASSLRLTAGSGGMFATGLAAATGGNLVVCINNTTNQLFYGSSNTSCNSSSLRYKTDIDSVKLGLDEIKALRPVSFTYKSNNEKALGFIAEEVATVDERLVVRDKDGVIDAINSDYIIPIITKSIQEISDMMTVIKTGAASDTVTSTIESIQQENNMNAVEYIRNILGEKNHIISNLISLRITSLRGYFDELFTRKIHSKQICLEKSDGKEVCINGDQLEEIINKDNIVISKDTEDKIESEVTSIIPEVLEGNSSTTENLTSENNEEKSNSSTTEDVVVVPEDKSETVVNQPQVNEEKIIEIETETPQ